ncbi:MAG: hypothetical protein HC875_00635, partial [Anaerolineales bacterium]|nr:hypothetical protein [Anaerolineales bacterium]
MTKSSPELAAFAASLDAHPDDVEDMYQYCLAMVMVETGQAELTKIELRGREPWCTFKSITGDEFVVLRPMLSQTEEREMMETIWSIFHPNEGSLRVVRPALAASPNPESDAASPPPPPPPAGLALGNRIFRDLNGNGLQDGGEPGLAGVRVLLFGGSPYQQLGSVLSAGDGSLPVQRPERRQLC